MSQPCSQQQQANACGEQGDLCFREISGRHLCAPDGGPRADAAGLGGGDDTRLSPDAAPCSSRCVAVLSMANTVTQGDQDVPELISRAERGRAAESLAEARAICQELVRAELECGRGQLNAFDTVAQRTGLTPRRIKSLWYGEVQPPSTDAALASLTAELHSFKVAENDHVQRALVDAERRVSALRERLGVGLPSQHRAVGLSLGVV